MTFFFLARPLWPQYRDRMYMKYDRPARSSNGAAHQARSCAKSALPARIPKHFYRDLPSPAGGCLPPNVRWTKTTVLPLSLSLYACRKKWLSLNSTAPARRDSHTSHEIYLDAINNVENENLWSVTDLIRDNRKKKKSCTRECEVTLD